MRAWLNFIMNLSSRTQHELSGGQQQDVAIARALIGKPDTDIILADWIAVAFFV